MTSQNLARIGEKLFSFKRTMYTVWCRKCVDDTKSNNDPVREVEQTAYDFASA